MISTLIDPLEGAESLRKHITIKERKQRIKYRVLEKIGCFNGNNLKVAIRSKLVVNTNIAK